MRALACAPWVLQRHPEREYGELLEAAVVVETLLFPYLLHQAARSVEACKKKRPRLAPVSV